MATKRITTYGLEGLYIGDIVSNVIQSQWERLGVNLEGTFSLEQEDTEETDINIEESDNPIVQILKAGKASFTTSIPDLSFNILEKLFNAEKTTGVDVEGETVTLVTIPDSAAYIFKSFKIVPKVGVEQIYFPKGQITAKILGNLTKDSTLNVELTVTALTPDYAGQTARMIALKEGDQPGFWLGTKLVDDAFDNITAVSDGALNLDIDGAGAADITGISFTGDLDWDDIVATLNAKTTGATWSFNKEEFRFTLTSDNNAPTDANPSSIRIAAPASGTDVTVSGILAMINGGYTDGY